MKLLTFEYYTSEFGHTYHPIHRVSLEFFAGIYLIEERRKKVRLLNYKMPRQKKDKKPPTFSKERKAFVNRMVKKVGSWACEMAFTKTLFEKYPVDFLNVVKPPFEMNSLAYFINGDGERYLQIKFAEFNFRPTEEKIQVFEGKIGEDIPIIKGTSIRQFLK